MKRPKVERRFVVCIRNDDCEDLQLRKIYEVLPDDAALKEGLARIVDESGEDYLYPAEYFLPLKVSQSIENALLEAVPAA